MNNGTPIARLLHNLGYLPNDVISICTRGAGEKVFRRPVLTPVRDVGAAVLAVQEGADCWFGAFPLRDEIEPGRRGGARDAVAIRTLPVDLDDDKLKPAAQDLMIARLTDELGARPAVVATGGGRHLHWRVAHTKWSHWTDSDDVRWKRVYGLYRRWDAYMAQLAAEYGGSTDGLKDLARIWRVPGTSNHKRTRVRPVRLLQRATGAVRLTDLRRLLDAAGVVTVAGSVSSGSATSAEVEQYLAENTEWLSDAKKVWFLTGLRKRWPSEYAYWGSCYKTAVSLYPMVVRQVRAGYCDAPTADSVLFELFHGELLRRGRFKDDAYREINLPTEWHTIQRFGVENGSAADPVDIYKEVERRRLQARRPKR